MGAIFVAALRVFSSYSMIFAERKFETGLMRAFGASSSQIIIVLLAEIGVVGFIGSIVGLVIGALTSAFMSQLVNSILVIQNPIQADLFFQPAIILDPVTYVIAGLLGVLLSIVAGSVPAITATRDVVAESLRTSHSGVGSPASVPLRFRSLSIRGLQIVGILMTTFVLIQIASDYFRLGLIRNDWLRAFAIPAFIILVAGFSDRFSRPSFFINIIKIRTKPVVRKLFSTSLRRRSAGAILVFNLFLTVAVVLLFSSNVTYSITNSWENTLAWQSSSTNVVTYIDDSASSSAIEQIEDQQNISTYSELASVYRLLNYQNHVDLGLIFGIEPESFQNLASLGLVATQNPSLGFSVINQAANSCIISKHTSNVLR